MPPDFNQEEPMSGYEEYIEKIRCEIPLLEEQLSELVARRSDARSSRAQLNVALEGLGVQIEVVESDLGVRRRQLTRDIGTANTEPFDDPRSVTSLDLAQFTSMSNALRTKNALKRRGIETIDQLCQHTRDEILGWEWFGQKGVTAIEKALASRGYSIKK